MNSLAGFLRDRDMLPAIAFVFSRKQVESCAQDITVPLLEFDSKVGYTVRRECEQIIRKLPNHREYLELPEYEQLVALLEKGIGIHHSGMIPVLREIVELMISKKYIKLLFATESFAIGLDCPIRTAIFTSLTKFDGHCERLLMAHEYSQMSGRAGRRGIDTVGHVVHCNNLFSCPSLTEYKTVMSGVPQQLVSKFRVSYPLVLNLMKQGITKDFHLFSEKSMIQNEIAGSIAAGEKEAEEMATTIFRKTELTDHMRTPCGVCHNYKDLLQQAPTLVNKKRREVEKQIANLLGEHRYIKEDTETLKELLILQQEHKQLVESVEYRKTYLRGQTDSICDVLVDRGFIRVTDSEDSADYELTTSGTIAAHIAEIHPLPLTELLLRDSVCLSMTSVQWVGLLSCFTDIKVPEDLQAHTCDGVENITLRQQLRVLAAIYRHYDDQEVALDIRTGIRYEDALQYNLVDLAMKWCELTEEVDCKAFIQGEVGGRGISIGEFTKAMMKIVVVAKEWCNACEYAGWIELKHTLTGIESMILKYVLTTQSLYV